LFEGVVSKDFDEPLSTDFLGVLEDGQCLGLLVGKEGEGERVGIEVGVVFFEGFLDLSQARKEGRLGRG
jgi:hypothetical protein